MAVRVSDYVMSCLADHGVRHIFMLAGGGAMHLNDSLLQEPRIQHICNHHEQACAMAAEGYARVSRRLGVINVTSGPGAINALNGVFGAWTDSVPMLVLSGQVKRETCMATYDIPGLRQLGDQEADIVSMAKPITKYIVSVWEPETIRYHLEKALHLAQAPRPGPCWLDIPLDVQAARVEPQTLAAYDPGEEAAPWNRETLRRQCAEIVSHLQQARRPVVLVGSGVLRAGAEEEFAAVIRRLGIPVTTGWGGMDLLPSSHPLYCGRLGTMGDRAGNFTVQNADLILVVGCRLNLRQVSYNWQSFARGAFKIQVDADPAELQKPTVQVDLPVLADARMFLQELAAALETVAYQPGHHPEWLAWCKERMQRYPVLQAHHLSRDGALNPYHFTASLWEQLQPQDLVVCGAGAACVIPLQVANLKPGQRVLASIGARSMGYALPAAIGAAIAQPDRRVVAFVGDGGMQLNIQELQTVVHHQLPLKILVMNNGGYRAIRSTQANFFGRFIGESPASGMSLPDYVDVARAYGLEAVRFDRADFAADLTRVLETPGPVLAEVVLDPNQELEPRSRSKQLPDGRIVSPPLEDMYPFLERKELQENLLDPVRGASE